MRKRTVKILKGIAIAVVVLGVLYAIAVVVSSAKLRRAYTALEKAGRPMNAGNVIPPAVPDAENAALLYESAILLLKAQPAEGEVSLPTGQNNLLGYLGDLSGKFLTESIEPNDHAKLAQQLERDVVHEALAIVKQGARRSSCRFEHDYKAGFNMPLSNLSGVRDLIRTLGASASLEAQAGRPETAWDLAQTQLRFADALRNEPILISQLVRFASIRLSCQTIQKMCEVAPPNAEQNSSLENMLSDYEDRKPLILALDGERLIGGEWTFNLLSNESPGVLKAITGDESDFGEFLLRLYAAFKPLSLADHAAYVRIMGEYTTFAQQPYSPNETSDMDKIIGQTQGRLHFVTAMIIPAIGRVKEVCWETIAQIRVTRAGLAVLQDKTAQGAFPQTLESLKLKDIGDPFCDGQLVYRPAPNGFTLYSVGKDRKDNNGSPKQKKQETDWDIVWHFPSAVTK